jgi:hypothetical protein
MSTADAPSGIARATYVDQQIEVLLVNFSGEKISRIARLSQCQRIGPT